MALTLSEACFASSEDAGNEVIGYKSDNVGNQVDPTPAPVTPEPGIITK